MRKRRTAEHREAICKAQCSAAGCDRPARGNSAAGPLCGMHAQRFVKQGTVDLSQRKRMPVPACQQCGEPVHVRCASRARGRGYGFCSQKCAGAYAAARRAVALVDRFWPKVKVGAKDECWPWIAGAKTHWGYGRINVGGKAMHANRVAYELTHGPVPDGMFVCHRCDNPSCCNPAHLWLGTGLENTQDMDRKGRRRTVVRRGEASTSAKLTESDVRKIRASALEDKRAAEAFGITPQQVRNIRSRRHWRHVD